MVNPQGSTVFISGGNDGHLNWDFSNGVSLFQVSLLLPDYSDLPWPAPQHILHFNNACFRCIRVHPQPFCHADLVRLCRPDVHSVSCRSDCRCLSSGGSFYRTLHGSKLASKCLYEEEEGWLSSRWVLLMVIKTGLDKSVISYPWCYLGKLENSALRIRTIIIARI